MSAALIVNPHASRVSPELILAVEHELAASGPVETVLSDRAGHAMQLAEELSARHERIYVFSGDGGYNEVVNGLTRDIAVGFVPGGSTSVLPRALGVPRDPLAAARLFAAAATTRRMSLGRVNGRRFTFSAGLGLDAELVRRVEALGRNSGRRGSDIAKAVACGADLPPRGPCPRGLAVVSSDFQSSEVALLAPNGTVRSAAFASSVVASMPTVLPLTRPASASRCSSQVKTDSCVSRSINRRVREIVE